MNDSSNGKLQAISADDGCQFLNYGSHSDAYPVLPFFNAAAAIGQTREEIDLFIVRLDEAFTTLRGVKSGPAAFVQTEESLSALAPEEEESKKATTQSSQNSSDHQS